MGKIEGFKGGRYEIGIIKKQKRYKDGGKLCYGCNIIRKLDDYYTTSTRCKYCTNENSRKRWKKKKKPLW